MSAVDQADAASDMPDPFPQEPVPPSPLEVRALVARSDLAGTMRAIQKVAALTADNLATDGPVDELMNLFGALGALERQAGNEAEILGAIISAHGSA